MSAALSQAVLALLRLRLEAHRGEWVTVLDLALHLGLSEPVVRHHLAHLERQHAVRLRVAALEVDAACIAGGVDQSAPGAETARDSSADPPVQHRWHLQPRLERSERLPDGLAAGFGPHLNPRFAV